MMEPELDPTHLPLSTSNQRSGMATAAAIFSVMCPIGIGGALGMLLGIIALRQISSGTAGRDGSAMAWIGIFAGAVQLVAIGAGYMHVRNTLEETQRPVATFMAALSERDAAGVSESCANGLKPLLEHGTAGKLVDRVDDAVGHFKGTGARADGFNVKVRNAQLVYTVQYPLQYDSGAPVTGTFSLVKEGGALRLLGFRLESPVLRPKIELGASGSSEIAEYDGPREKEKSGLREFKK